MDKLKEEILKKKAQMGKNACGYIKKGDILKKEAEQIIAEKQKAEELAREKLRKQLEEIEKQEKEKLVKTMEQKEKVKNEKIPIENAVPSNEDIEKIKLSKKEIMAKLREYMQPITIFGEDDFMRYKRLCKYEQEKGISFGFSYKK